MARQRMEVVTGVGVCIMGVVVCLAASMHGNQCYLQRTPPIKKLPTAAFLSGMGNGRFQQLQNVAQFGTYHLDLLGTDRDFNFLGDRVDLLFNEMAVELVARTADGETLLIQQLANAPDQQYFMVLIIAPVATPLDWFELGKFLLPVAQHMRLDATKFADFTDGEVAFGGNRRQNYHRRLVDAFVHGLTVIQRGRAAGCL